MKIYPVVLLLFLSCCATAPAEPQMDQGIEAEAKAYAAMLSDRMNRGELTEAEARSLYTQKVNELADRAVAQDRARRAGPASTPQTTDCKPDGYGGVRCRTR